MMETPLHLETMDIKTEETFEIDAIDVFKSEDLSEDEKPSSESHIEIAGGVEFGNSAECEELKIEPYIVLQLKPQKMTEFTEEEHKPLVDFLEGEDMEILNEVDIKAESGVEGGDSNIEEQADREGLKTEPDEIIADIRPACFCSERGSSSKLSVRDVEYEPIPPKKMKFAEKGCICSLDILKRTTRPKDGEVLSETEIKVEYEVVDEKTNEEQAEWEQVKTEPYEIVHVWRNSAERAESTVYSVPARNIEVDPSQTLPHKEPNQLNILKSNDGEVLNEIEIKIEYDEENGSSNLGKPAEWEELKTEPYETLPHEEPNQLNILKSNDGEVLNEIEIKIEYDEENGNSNFGKLAEWEELKTEPYEIAYSDPAQNVETNLKDGYFQNEYKIEGKYDMGDEKSNVEEHVERQELDVDAVPRTSDHSYSVTAKIPKFALKPIKYTELPSEKHIQSHVGCVRYSPIKRYGFDRLTEQLIAFHRMSEFQARYLSKKLLCELLEWIFGESQRAKLQAYQLRLKVTELARSMDLPGFTPDDAWFIDLKNQLPRDLFVAYRQKPMNYNMTRSRYNIKAIDPRNNSKTELFKKLAEWYHKEYSVLGVSPGQLERVAYRIAEGIGLQRFYLSKADMLWFVTQQGLYCNVNGNVSRFMKVKDGILGLLFEATFEAWYYEWHRSIEDLLLDTRYVGEKHWPVYKGYLAILSDWLAEGVCLNMAVDSKHCNFLLSDSSSVVSAETKFADAVFGPNLAAYHNFHRVFCDKLKAEICTIRSFNSKFAEKYCYRPYTLCSDHLKKNAEELALNMGLSNVVIRKNWLRRFAELTVACSLGSNESHSHPEDPMNYFPLSGEDFDAAFEHWFANGCPRDVVASYSCIAGGSIEPYGSQSKECPTFTFETHLAEVDKWYKEHSVKCFVKSYELKEKSEEIAQCMGLSPFVASKFWMKKCLIRNGLRFYNERDGTITVSKVESSNDPEFEELFEAWYREGTCTKCSKRLGYRNSDDGEKIEAPLVKSSVMDAAIHDWYVASGLVAPGVLEKKAAEVAKKLHNENFVRSKRWVEEFIERHGLYCNINGERQLFFKSAFEFLRCTFLSEFEIWYNHWPLTVEKSLSTESVTNANFELYKEALLNWYLEVSQVGKIPWLDIETKSASIIKKKMPGITPQDVEVWTKRWCRQCNDVVQRIRGFDYAMRIWYFENKKTRFISAQELKAEAEKCANEKMRFTNFVATEVWLMRFVERYGIYSSSGGVPKFLNSVDMQQYELNKLFISWCAYCTDGSKPSSIDESEFDSESSSSDPNSKPAEIIEIMSVIDDDQLDRSSAFESEVVLWYQKVSSKFEVSPGLYMEKVLGIQDPDLTVYNGLVLGAGQRKNCIRKLVALHGLQVGSPWFFKNIRLFPAECSILKWRFELAFEIWYHAYPLRVEDVKVNDCPLTKGDLNLIKLYLSALHVWYVNLGQAIVHRTVSPEEIRIKEDEITNKLARSHEKRALITKWCRGWCSESVAWIDKILSLDSELSLWYNSRKYLVKPKDLKEQAAKTADMLGMGALSVTQKWMRRFVQLHGLHFMYKGEVRDFAVGLSKPNWSNFGRHFNDWLETDKKA